MVNKEIISISPFYSALPLLISNSSSNPNSSQFRPPLPLPPCFLNLLPNSLSGYSSLRLFLSPPFAVFLAETLLLTASWVSSSLVLGHGALHASAHSSHLIILR